MTVVTALAILLAVLVSVELAVRVIVLVSVPARVGTTTIVAVTPKLLLTTPTFQVTVPPTFVHVPCEALEDTKLTVAGRGSDTTTPVALSGPLFETTIE